MQRQELVHQHYSSATPHVESKLTPNRFSPNHMKENHIGDAVERVKLFLAEEFEKKEVFVIDED